MRCRRTSRCARPGRPTATPSWRCCCAAARRPRRSRRRPLGVSGFGAAQRLHLAPAFDVLPSGQALGYQQMRVGRDGADATLDNALSEHRAFSLTRDEAERACREVARVADGWQRHFAACGVTPRDLALLAEQIDRPFLREQRVQRAGVR
jgi:hypothetical protein